MLAMVVLGGLLLGPLAGPALACPLCKEANETEPNLPRAYMYSILFMLAMPATVLTGFSIGFYRLSRRQQSALATDELTAESGDVSLADESLPSEPASPGDPLPPGA